MGKKYIIELLDDCPSEFKGIIVFGLTPSNQISAKPIPVEDLTPYTAPDLEQVRKEAYDKCMDEAEMSAYKLYSPKIDEAYQRGLNDAWEAVRKIELNVEDGGISTGVIEEIFGTHAPYRVLMNFTASEVIGKLKAYEQEQDEKKKTDYYFEMVKDAIETTAEEYGMSLDEVAAVLEKMRGEQDG